MVAETVTAETSRDLFKSLDEKHPDYIEWEEEWIRYRDVVGDVLVDERKYLPKNLWEPDDQYEFRVRMSEMIPESGLVVDRMVGALYRDKPRRDFKGQESELKQFIDRSTRKGESWDSTTEDISFRLMSYGTIRALVNVPPADIDGEDGVTRNESGVEVVRTRVEEQRAGIQPYVVLYSPLSVIDWEHDENQVLVFCRIREDRVVKDPRKKSKEGTLSDHVTLVRFIEYRRNEVEWWEFVQEQDSDDDPVLIENGDRVHGLGMVPLVTEELRTIKPFIGSSFIRYSSKADIRKFQAESDQAYDTYLHAHPFLAVWTEDDLKRLGVGSSSFLKMSPGDGATGKEDVKYVETPKSAFEALQNVINEYRTQIFRQGQVDPMGIVASGNQAGSSLFQASGASRAWSFGTSEARILRKLASKMEQVEAKILEVVLRWMAGDRDIGENDKLFKGTVQYPEEFDLASTSQLIEERSEIGALVNSPTLLRIIDKRIASSKVGDVSADDLQKIYDEIDNGPLLSTQAGRSASSPFEMPGSGSRDAVGDEPSDDDDANIDDDQDVLEAQDAGGGRRSRRGRRRRQPVGGR